MKIAFISYEYPPETAFGGIATYAQQAVKMLSQNDHQVTVICGTHQENVTQMSHNITIHKIHEKNPANFRFSAFNLFKQNYNSNSFDVIEGTDYCASASEIKKHFPTLPLVVKLHTPSYIIEEINKNAPRTYFEKFNQLKIILGALRRFKRPKFPALYSSPISEIEKKGIQLANNIAAPSLAILNKIKEDLNIDISKFSLVPYPYQLNKNFIKSSNSTNNNNTITFVGRLEYRKGIIDFINAIPIVLRTFPKTKFKVIGKSTTYPYTNLDMKSILVKQLGKHINAVDFIGHQTLESIPHHLSKSDICVFPSLWESFGLVCCEAMAAGKIVIGSSNGGMVEILNHGQCGILIPPKSPKKIAKEIIRCIQNPELKSKIAAKAKKFIHESFNPQRILKMQLESYLNAIEKCNCTN